MHEAHDHRALTDGGRHPFHRTSTHVTDGEHARNGRLEQEWTAAGTVAVGHGRHRVGPGEDEAALVRASGQ